MFQAAKWSVMQTGSLSDREDYVRSVLKDPDPNYAKQLGRRVAIHVDIWDHYKDGVMRSVVKEKFAQNDDLRASLLDTGAAMLMEGNTWGDTYWGRCNFQGYNKLGTILMEVRGYYYWKSVE